MPDSSYFLTHLASTFEYPCIVGDVIEVSPVEIIISEVIIISDSLWKGF